MKNGIYSAIPIMTVVFLSFVIIGMALPVLPLQVHNVLGFNTFVVGIVAGCQFVASLISRLWAGRLSDTKGSKYAVRLGLYLALGGGLFYSLSCLTVNIPMLSVSSLLVGRTLLGAAESLIITGGILWGLQLVSLDQSAKVIAWVGMAMFAAMAVGAPLGSIVFENTGFTGIALSTLLMTTVALFIIQRIEVFSPLSEAKSPDRDSVIGKVFLPGVGFALSGITFGAITTFLTLLFSIRHWNYGAIAFTIFALMLILTRVWFGHLSDKYGGARVSLYCVIIQAVGLCLIGTASSGLSAMIGSALAGAGFSLVFPGLGLEAIKRVPTERRGEAMGVYNAFLDVTLGFGSPALGYFAGKQGVGSVFILSAFAAVIAIPVVLFLQRGYKLSLAK